MDNIWHGFFSTGVFTALIILVVVTYVTVTAGKSAEPGQLKFPKFIKALGIVCFMFFIVPLWFFLTDNYDVDKPGETPAIIGLILGFGFFAVYFLGEGFLLRGGYDRTNIWFFSPWTGKKRQTWSTLDSLSFNRAMYWYVLKFEDGNIIRISWYLAGRDDLLALLEQKGFRV